MSNIAYKPQSLLAIQNEAAKPVAIEIKPHLANSTESVHETDHLLMQSRLNHWHDLHVGLDTAQDLLRSSLIVLQNSRGEIQLQPAKKAVAKSGVYTRRLGSLVSTTELVERAWESIDPVRKCGGKVHQALSPKGHLSSAEAAKLETPDGLSNAALYGLAAKRQRKKRKNKQEKRKERRKNKQSRVTTIRRTKGDDENKRVLTYWLEGSDHLL